MKADTGAVKTVKNPARTTAAKGKVANSQKPGISDEQRPQMIADARCYPAQKRGVDGGDTLLDWQDASNEIDKSLQ